MLQNIERATKQRIEMAPIPTIADLRARRLETRRAALRETLSGGSLEAYRAIAESLAREFDPIDVAAAALKPAEPPVAGGAEDDIPAMPAAGERRPRREPSRTRKGRPGRDAEMARIFIGAGRALRITPADIVGAIANEAGVSGRAVGAITIGERHSTVDVPQELVDDVVAALRASTVKGRRVTVRRYEA